LARSLTDADGHTGELAAIAQVERQMAQALARLPGIARCGAAERAASRARETAARLTSWDSFLEISRRSLPAALTRFKEIPVPKASKPRELLGLLLRHEVALIEFIEQAAAGCPPEKNLALHQIDRDLAQFLEAQ
jgi:hypothetical protein